MTCSVLLIGDQAHDGPVFGKHLRPDQNPEHGEDLEEEVLEEEEVWGWECQEENVAGRGKGGGSGVCVRVCVFVEGGVLTLRFSLLKACSSFW